ncbi:MAG: ABC transporter permease [Anaerolineales bacterium]
MKTIWRVLRKEILNLTRNRRRLFMMILFNLVLLPCLAIIPMGMITRKTVQGAVQKLEVPVQGMQYAPELIQYITENESITIIDAENVEALVHERKYAAGLIISADFKEQLQSGQSALVIVVVDKSKSLSLEGERLKNVVQKYNETILQDRLKEKDIAREYLTPVQVEELNTATEQETSGSQLSLLIPGFIMTFGLTSGLSIAIGSIAGEKEEQTLEPVLFTPVSRSQLVFGKLLSVLVNVIFSALGFVFTILFSAFIFLLAVTFFLRDIDVSAIAANPSPAVNGALPFAGAASLSLPSPLALVLFVVSMLPIILLGAALQIMISSIARNSEEAYTYSLPLNILSLAPLLVSFFLDEFVPVLGHYAIPIFGTILSMRDLLSNHIQTVSLSVMFVSSIGYAALAIGVSIWMFNREEVVFRA